MRKFLKSRVLHKIIEIKKKFLAKGKQKSLISVDSAIRLDEPDK